MQLVENEIKKKVGLHNEILHLYFILKKKTKQIFKLIIFKFLISVSELEIKIDIEIEGGNYSLGRYYF